MHDINIIYIFTHLVCRRDDISTQILTDDVILEVLYPVKLWFDMLTLNSTEELLIKVK